jgi:hypothetical protein
MMRTPSACATVHTDRPVPSRIAIIPTRRRGSTIPRGGLTTMAATVSTSNARSEARTSRQSGTMPFGLLVLLAALDLVGCAVVYLDGPALKAFRHYIGIPDQFTGPLAYLFAVLVTAAVVWVALFVLRWILYGIVGGGRAEAECLLDTASQR